MSEQNPTLFNQVDEQIANGQLATVLVERKDGSIQTGQLEVGMGEGKSAVFYGDSGKMVGNEKLTDQYQQKLAEKLAGVALRDNIEAPIESPVDKYAKEGNPYAALLDPDLTDEQQAEISKRIQSVDRRTDEQKRADAEQLAAEAMNRQRTASDYKYSQARQSGADHEAAEASANRAFHKTHDELLADELKKAGLQ